MDEDEIVDIGNPEDDGAFDGAFAGAFDGAFDGAYDINTIGGEKIA